LKLIDQVAELVQVRNGLTQGCIELTGIQWTGVAGVPKLPTCRISVKLTPIRKGTSSSASKLAAILLAAAIRLLASLALRILALALPLTLTTSLLLTGLLALTLLILSLTLALPLALPLALALTLALTLALALARLLTRLLTLPLTLAPSLLLPLALLLACSCHTEFRLRRIDDATWFQRESRTALEAGTISERTRQYLRREGLFESYREDPAAVLEELHERLLANREREVAFYLAELCYQEARRSSGKYAARFDLSTVRYAYAYLFDTALAPPATGFDPMFRWACDFYNRSLAQRIDAEGKSWLAASRCGLSATRVKTRLALASTSIAG